MPTAAKRPCAAPNCVALVDDTSMCPAHRQQHQRAYDQHRGSRSSRGYDAAWYRWLAAYKLAQDVQDPEQRATEIERRNKCASCGATQRLEFDHITPLSAGGQRLSTANVQPLCHACHLSKTNRERGISIGVLGMGHV